MAGSYVHETEMSTPKYVISIFIFRSEGRALNNTCPFQSRTKNNKIKVHIAQTIRFCCSLVI